MNKKKRLLLLLALCILSAIISLFIGILNRGGGILFVGSAVAWGVSVIGVGICIIELDKVSDYMDSYS